MRWLHPDFRPLRERTAYWLPEEKDIVQSSIRYLTLILYAGAAWLMLNPYEGIWHDGRLYTVQALRLLYPESLSGDVFFIHGSQSSYTFFPQLYARLIDLAGIDHAALLITLLGQVVLFAGAWYLAVHLLGFHLAPLFLVLFATLPGFENVVLAQFELFPAPRSIAMGASLLALAAVLNGRWWWAGFGAIFAVSMHPLVAAGAAATWMLLLRYRVFFALISIGVVSSVLLGLIGLKPFFNLFSHFDPLWFELVNQRSPFLFVEYWAADDWNLVLFELVVVLFASRLEGSALRRFLLAVVAAVVFGLLLSGLGGSLLKNTLIVQFQPWRVIWMLHVATALAIALIIRRALVDPLTRLVALLLLADYLLLDVIGAFPALAALAFWYWGQHRTIASHRLVKWGIYLLLVLAIGRYVADIQMGVQDAIAKAGPDRLRVLPLTVQEVPLVLTGLLVVLVLISYKLGSWRTAVPLVAVGLLALVIGLSVFDQRKWYDLWSGESVRLASVMERIPPDATVFWDRGVQATWFALHRSHYMSPAQSAGIVFSRPTALETKRRADRLLAAGFVEGEFAQHDGSLRSRPASYGMSSLAYLCQDEALDIVVTSRATACPAELTFEFRGIAYSLYACNSLRAVSTYNPNDTEVGDSGSVSCSN